MIDSPRNGIPVWTNPKHFTRVSERAAAGGKELLGLSPNRCESHQKFWEQPLQQNSTRSLESEISMATSIVSLWLKASAKIQGPDLPQPFVWASQLNITLKFLKGWKSAPTELPCNSVHFRPAQLTGLCLWRSLPGESWISCRAARGTSAMAGGSFHKRWIRRIKWDITGYRSLTNKNREPTCNQHGSLQRKETSGNQSNVTSEFHATPTPHWSTAVPDALGMTRDQAVMTREQPVLPFY